MKAYRNHRSRGFSMIEQALVLPLLLVFIMAAVDVNSVLHGYTALKEGVRTSLRCLYVVDGQCVETAPQSPSRLYKVSIPSYSPKYFGDAFHYSGTGSWIEGPVFRYHGEATVLGQAQFQVPSLGFVAEKNIYPTIGHLPYYVKVADFPKVGGTDFDPSFSFANSNAHYSPEASMTIGSSVSGSTLSEKNIGTVSFRIPSPGTEPRPCYLAKAFNSGSSSHEPDFSSPCAASWPWDDGATFTTAYGKSATFERPRGSEEVTDFTYVVLQITGSDSGTDPGAIGKVSIYLTQPGEARRDLGGRMISLQGNDDFFVRGTPYSNLSGSLTTSHREYADYQAIKVRYNQDVTLHFHLESANGKKVQWKGSKFKVFAPIYDEGQLDEQCSVALAANANPSNCVMVLPGTIGKTAKARSVTQDLSSPSAASDKIILGCAASEDAALSALSNTLHSQGKTDAASYSLSLNPQQSCPGTLTLSSDCPDAGQSLSAGSAPNYGVTELPGTDGFIRNSPEAESICPAASPLLEGTGLVPQNVTWTTRSASLSNPSSISARQEDCSFTPQRVALPTEWANYRHVNLTDPTVTSTWNLFTGSLEPQDYQGANPQYQCDAFSIHSAVFDSSSPLVDDTSIFKGNRPDLGCSWETSVRTEAMNLGLDPNTYFKASRSSVGHEIELPGKPTDSCVSYRYDPTARVGVSELGTFAENHFPQQCVNGSSPCASEFVGFEGGDFSHPRLQSAEALKIGYEAVEAIYPRAKTGCSDTDCVSLNVPELGSDTMVVRGELKVPMRLFFGKTVTLSYSEERMREASLIK